MTWFLDNLSVVAGYLASHLALALPPIGLSFLLAIPLGWLANRYGWLRGPLLTGAGLTYAIPLAAAVHRAADHHRHPDA